jgi:hypothetical protein
VLHVVRPLPNVLVAVRENHRALAVFLTGPEVTLVPSAIFIGQLALTFKDVAHKLTLISLFTLSKEVYA